MMDCKKALEEAGGDMEKAAELLRVKYAAKAEKRATEAAGEGPDRELHPFHRREWACWSSSTARPTSSRAPTSSGNWRKTSRCRSPRPSPIAVRVEDLPAEVVERERRIFEAQVVEQKKPEQMRAKIVEGMLRKFYQESVLLEQPFIKDDKVTIGDMVRAYSGKTGEKVEVKRFARFELGSD